MSNPVTLDNLHDMTGGDRELEKELFDVYINSAEDCLKGLKFNIGPGQEDGWRTQAHAWKGMSLNLGAETLGKLCAEAQFNHLAPQEKKQEMLAAIEEEYAKVKAYLRTL